MAAARLEHPDRHAEEGRPLHLLVRIGDHSSGRHARQLRRPLAGDERVGRRPFPRRPRASVSDRGRASFSHGTREADDPPRGGRGVDHHASRRGARARRLPHRDRAHRRRRAREGKDASGPTSSCSTSGSRTAPGLDVCRELRASSNVPIIILSARGEEADRVVGLELGADDYVVKPFSAREVIARIRAVLRRSAAPAAAPAGPIEIGSVRLDPARRTVAFEARTSSSPARSSTCSRC